MTCRSFATNQTVLQVEKVVRATAEKYGKEHPDKDGKPRKVLKSLTAFEGGGGPRFWFSVSPQLQQLNYAQLIIELTDKEDTPKLIGAFQEAISNSVRGRAWTHGNCRRTRWIIRWNCG